MKNKHGLKPKTVRSWFKPTRWFEYDGSRWEANMHVALRGLSTGVGGPPLPVEWICDLASVPGKPMPRRARRYARGYVRYGNCYLNGYYVDLAESAFSPLSWRLAGDCLIGSLQGTDVAFVMVIYGGPVGDCTAPLCPACLGRSGERETCDDCAGSGFWHGLRERDDEDR
jgi:hypothetical protein